ncbi:glycoside hydrolase family 3 N-terminal domain-containing protein [Terrihabitans rhizophilus]|uniref:beta-glucosidase n=1 Tax=Terrihabitans rhizophilus TaxID=3092662 RepID=A0ABU4RK13_9HYPH|nr:glycoside hydrolase family 3 N-terminal domain-containing protein [Terrihabitans sp. PJ23]MDX6804523.1 glycoside hydrolase family 3 N-terminal domain-containing protein [Terrihabitans sp. PJ23]
MTAFRLLIPAILACALPLSAAAQDARSGNVASRVEDLLGRMTLEEKIGQLIITGVDQKDAPEIVARGGAGATIGLNTAQGVADIQRIARASRLGIPLLTGLDVVHGFRTLFPMPLAVASSFDTDLARQLAELSAREALASGINWTFAPMVDMGRDARWGRIVEGAGEDVLLAREMSRAQVEGYSAAGMASTLKHFVGYGGVEAGRDYDSASIPANELRNLHYPPFRSGIAAGADSVMSALSVLNGTPATADKARLTDVLKGEMRFGGFVVSDWSSIGDLIHMGVAADGAEAARKAMLAGVDMDMMSGYYAAHLLDEVRAGRVPEARIDDAARRVLGVKFRRGLFDNPQPDPSASEAAALTPELRDAARAAATRSMVLLRNENSLLPFTGKHRKIAVVGHLAQSAGEQLGPHEARGQDKDAVSILSGIRKEASTRGVDVAFSEGCDRACTDTSGFAGAVEAVQDADVSVVVLGEPREFSGEGATRSRLGFWGRQDELLDQLIATGKPVVLVIMAGRPLDISRFADRVPSILMAWYPGTEGGNAVADLLFGRSAPSARLPVTWPRSVGQVPVHYDGLTSGRPYGPASRFTLKYVDLPPGPQFPFGHGLTYTRFEYSGFRVETPSIAAEGEVRVSVDLRNAGERDGVETVQLYVRDVLASQSRPVCELKAFQKVALKPGETRRVVLAVPAAEFGFHREGGTYVVEPGEFRLWVGGDAASGTEGSFSLTSGIERGPE